MKLVFMGTPRFAVPPLLALADAGHEISGVVCRTDKPSGRGRAVSAPEVKTAAVKRGIPVYQPVSVRERNFIETLRQLHPAVIVVAAYGQILPDEILTMPPHGCVNIHASLLPAYRGAAPVNWSVIHGDSETGITIMQMDAGMDTGAILMQESIPIERSDTAGSLTDKLSQLGANMIVRALPLLESGRLEPRAQDESRATMAPLLRKDDGFIDWRLPAAEILNRVRGLTPWPGAYSFVKDIMLKILEAEVAPGTGEAGTIYSSRPNTMEIGTGRDMLRLLTVQPAGKKPMPAPDFLRGHRVLAGKKFDVNR